MEEVKIYNKSSDLINLATFRDNWKAIVDLKNEFKQDTEIEYLSREMGVTSDTAEELASVCSENTLYCGFPAEQNRQELLTTIPVDLNLASVKAVKQDYEKSSSDLEYTKMQAKRAKYKILDVLLFREPKNDQIADEFRASADDIVLTLTVYKEMKHATRHRRLASHDHVYNILGSQCLTDLRDKIRCAADLVVPGDFSENPDLPTDVCAKELYKSAFFYIEGAFYNDMRDPECRDNSLLIIKWASVPGRKMSKGMRNKKMEETRFIDLSICLGIPYLYQHQGDCQHIIIFNDVRMLHPRETCDIRNYPLMTSRSKRMRTICCVCNQDTARWVTYNDELAPQTPCYFCDRCFRALHYGPEGEKMCRFEAYKYFDMHVVL